MRHRTLALFLLLVSLVLMFPVRGATQEIVLIDSLALSTILDIPGQMSGRILTDNHPSDSGSTSSLGQTFRFSQGIDKILTLTISMGRTGVGGNPTVDLTAVISTSSGTLPTTALFSSNVIPAGSLDRVEGSLRLYPVTFTFPEGQTQLQKDTWYSFEIQTSATGTVSIGDGVSIYEAADGSDTAPGNVFWYSSAGYQTILTEDFAYEVRGTLPSSGGGGGGGGPGDNQDPGALPTGPLAGGSLIIVLAAALAGYWFGLKGKRR